MLMEEQQLKRERAEIEIENWTNKAIREMLFFDEQENLKFQFIQMGIVKSITGVYKVNDAVLVEVLKEFFSVFECTKVVLLLIETIPELNIRRNVLNELLTVVFMDAIGRVTICICEKIEREELPFNDAAAIKQSVMELFPVVVEKIYVQWKRNLKKQEEKETDIEEAKKIILEYFNEVENKKEPQ